jgi:hypothetical protein
MDLRRRDLGAVLGLAPRIALSKGASAEEARNGQRQREHQRSHLAKTHYHLPRVASNHFALFGHRLQKGWLSGRSRLGSVD